MSKIDLYDPKWIDLVFQDKNKEYGAYQLRKGTSKRNLLALAILMAAAIIVGGYLIYKIEADKRAAERQAYMEQLELSKLQEQAEELRVYEEKIHHLADQMIRIDLDDGVKHNYAIFQDVLAKIK